MKVKTKTLLELASLGSTLYVLSKDEELREQLSGYASKGKEVLRDLLHKDDEEEPDEDSLAHKIREKMSEAEAELEQRIEKMVGQAYRKLHIAHTDELKRMQQEVDKLRETIAQMSRPSA
ncbi:MAG: phasin family protein [Flavobacteriales bacterium]|nr:phasin family protein [Flavobacteriales bacterium]MCB9448720.1 phasin family protein [Flavobacteriales bacterium]